MNHLKKQIITLEPGKRNGKPCIRGMRITVYDVLGYLAAGMTSSEISPIQYYFQIFNFLSHYLEIRIMVLHGMKAMIACRPWI
jgi:uncharacterized protein (DUF433 family)